MMPLRDLAQSLVRIPSVNPMGGIADPEICGEQRLTEFLIQWAQQHGLAVERHFVASGRDNLLIASWSFAESPRPDVPRRLIDAHQDTVPVAGMTIAPFGGLIRDGRLWGRGACDVKGPLAAALTAVRDLAGRPRNARPAVALSCTVNEEYGFTGARALVEAWSTGQSEILPGPPESILVLEPTELQVVRAHKGVVRWRCRTHGTAAHSSDPFAGANAIYRMAPVLAALERYARDVVGSLAEHPRCGRPTLSVGTIHGGVSVNTVPDRCAIEIDRRLVPGELPETARQAVIDALADALGGPAWIEHAAAEIVGLGMDDANNATLARQLVHLAGEFGVVSREQGAPYGTNASAFAAANVPAVVFGPGSIAQAHTADEWIDLEQLEAAARILRAWCVAP